MRRSFGKTQAKSLCHKRTKTSPASDPLQLGEDPRRLRVQATLGEWKKRPQFLSTFVG